MAATEGAEKALVADLAPRYQLGTALVRLVSGLMLLPASVIFGALWDALGPQIAFAFFRHLRRTGDAAAASVGQAIHLQDKNIISY